MEFALVSYKSLIKSDYQLVQNHTLANKQGSCCPKHDELHTTWTKEEYLKCPSKTRQRIHKDIKAVGSSYTGTSSRRDFACHMSRTSPLKDMF